MVKYVRIDEELEIPKGIVCKINEKKVISVKGKLGEMTKDFGHARKIDVQIVGNKVLLHADFPRKNIVALTTTLKNILNNMFLGVDKGYEYRMKIVYSHFPITLEPPKKGSDVILIKNFLGERAPRITHSIGDVKIKANKEEVIVSINSLKLKDDFSSSMVLESILLICTSSIFIFINHTLHILPC